MGTEVRRDSETKIRIISLVVIMATIAVGLIPETHWLSALSVPVRVVVWILLIVAIVDVFDEAYYEYNWTIDFPLTIGWFGALAFVGWNVALGVYALAVIVDIFRRWNI